MSVQKIPQSAYQNRRDFAEAKHKQFGNLHERMKWLIGCKVELTEYAENCKDDHLRNLISDVSVAIMDLETEVAYFKPVNPPFGSRATPDEILQVLPPYKHSKNGQ